jgi:hypothetical protein
MQHVHINITGEGQTEREFSIRVLYKYFAPKGITVNSRVVRTSKTSRGGGDNYLKVRNDIIKWIKEENSRQPYFSTMFDLYALPNNFPGFEASLKINDPYQRVAFLEEAFAADIDHYKFIPYIQLHEFEALILANPESLLLEYPLEFDTIFR